MGRFKLGLVIPAFNEEESIKNVVLSVIKYGIPIVVNDASSDNTMQVALYAGAILVSHKERKGYDVAINSGFIKAKELGCTHVVTLDGDGQHCGTVISDFIEKFQQKYELVSGIRPYYARFSEALFSFYTNFKFGFVDPLCGMKGYSIKLYDEMGKFSSYTSVGTELALYALKCKKKFIQISVPVYERLDKPRFYGVVKSNWIIIKALTHAICKKQNIS